METNELHDIWKNIDSEISPKTINELNHTLACKTRKTINKFLFILSLDIIVCIGLIGFLIFTALNRKGDIIYQLNNFLLGLLTLISLIVSFLSWKKLQTKKFNLSLKDWLEQRIILLSGWLLGKYSKIYKILIPILLVMIMLSIHVYYEYKPFIEVMKNKESIFALIIGFLAGLFVSYYAINKIRRYQVKNLEFLKELHSGLCDLH